MFVFLEIIIDFLLWRVCVFWNWVIELNNIGVIRGLYLGKGVDGCFMREWGNYGVAMCG